MLILHGLLGSSDNWLPLAKALSASHRVFAVDLRNHGRSPHSEEFNYAVMVDDLLDLLEQHRLPAVHLLGHSMGGKVAMHLALKAPQSVARLIVADMAPRAYPPQHVEILEALLALDLTAYRSRTEIDAALQPRLPETGLRQFLLKNLKRDDSGAFQWKIPLQTIYRHYAPLNQPIETGSTYGNPALFIVGGRSDYVRHEDVQLIKQLFPRAELQIIPQAGHWVHADAPAEFAQLVQDFLADPVH